MRQVTGYDKDTRDHGNTEAVGNRVEHRADLAHLVESPSDISVDPVRHPKDHEQDRCEDRGLVGDEEEADRSEEHHACDCDRIGDSQPVVAAQLIHAQRAPSVQETSILQAR